MDALLSLLLAATSLVGAGSVEPPRTGQAISTPVPGKLIPLRSIEQKIIPLMKGFAYLGPEYYSKTGIYRLNFMGNRRKIWVEINARTGEVVGKSGS